MPEQLGLGSYPVFASANWCLTLATAACLAWVYARRRHLFVKPSMQLLGYSHIFFQWPLAFLSHRFQLFLPDPYALLFLVHGYELIGLLIAVQTADSTARAVWNRVTEGTLRGRDNEALDYPVHILGGLLLTGLVLYLLYVPPSATGLYAMLFTPDMASVARENALKLLDSPIPKAAFSLSIYAVAPLLNALLALRIAGAFADRAWSRLALSVCALMGLAVVAALSGARGGPVNMVILFFLMFLWRRKLQFPIWGWLAIIALALSPAVLMTLLREGRALSDAGDLVTNILNRAFVVPLESGIWYLDYTQMHGLFGPAAIPKLAWFLGIPPVDASNIIGLAYEFQPLPSVSATSGYLFSYYSYFGPLSLPLSLVGLWCLDLAVPVLARIPAPLTLPCLAATNLVALMFVQSDYTVVLLTHGFGLILLLAYLVGWLLQQKALVPIAESPQDSSNTWSISKS